MSEFVSVHTSRDQASDEPRIATLLLSRPPTNALTRQVCREIVEAAEDLGQRQDLAAIIVFGGHEIFSAGEDMPELQTLDTDEAEAAAQLCQTAVEALAAVPRPTIAAVTGYALGAGLSLALAADWRVSGDNAKFGATEILAGMAPVGGGATRLAAAVGPSKARDLVFTGRFVDAREALALGLVDELVAPDGVYDAALTRARRFLDYPPDVLAAAKAAFDRP
ncbi:enoyl-CoA hydratase [Mycolicibacterium obuense]|uniref:Probable enoyl-CoA hydratase EchA17 n=1 Tax=Mycolicibacterium obuense TaxID=1807 RepID=A0A0M2K2N5_9MYCO|nr:enoyl-CoA hydratase [Mycolicibacterium obuense]KKF01401.1 enoyl-CoA hydratase [Mycolicibacterium obuense]